MTSAPEEQSLRRIGSGSSEKREQINEDIKPLNNEINRTPKFPGLKVIGQFNKTYILAEYDSTLYLIDQHAAHERVNLERLINNISNPGLFKWKKSSSSIKYLITDSSPPIAA